MGFFRVSRIDDASSMVPTGRDTFEYHEGERRMRIVAELMATEPARVIYAGGIKGWLPPHEREELDARHRELILQRVCRYFALNGQTYCVE